MLNTNIAVICKSCVPYPRSTSLMFCFRLYSRVVKRPARYVESDVSEDDLEDMETPNKKCMFKSLQKFWSMELFEHFCTI